MKRKMHYSLYKNYYSQYPASDYDSATKSIMVDLPEVKQTRFPKSWYRNCNSYHTPGGCWVYTWNAGLAQKYLVECRTGAILLRRTIPPGINNRQIVIDTVNEFERESAIKA